MKYLKKYENEYESQKPDYDEFVVALDRNNDEILNRFLKANIGIVAAFGYDGNCIIDYKNIPRQIKLDYFGARSQYGNFHTNGRVFYEDEILCHSKNIKDLEPFIEMNRFNL